MTDDEIEKVAKKVSEQLRQELYSNVGEGIISLVWRGLLLLIIGIAAYGAGSFSLHLFGK